jgi:hypothetical protein
MIQLLGILILACCAGILGYRIAESKYKKLKEKDTPMSKILRQFAITLLQGAETLYTPEANTGVKITPAAVMTPQASDGNAYHLGSNVKAEFTLMGNSNVDYANLYAVLIANEKLDVSFADGNDSPAQDLLFTQVALTVDPVLDGDGTYEGIKCSFTRVLSKAQMAALHGAPGLLWISGNIENSISHTGGSGVLMTYVVAGVTKQVVTNADGDYVLSVPYNWTGTVTPTKTGGSIVLASFTATHIDYAAIKTSQVNQDYSVSIELI